MRIYDPRKWFDILFQFHKSDTLRKLALLICIICLYAGIAAWVEFHYFRNTTNPYLKSLSQLHGLLGFGLSLLLVFRTNTAYDRWWEGRKLWGALVNNSRNLAIKMHTLLRPTDEQNRDFFKRMIPLYATVLRKHLQSDVTIFSLDEIHHPELELLDKKRHVPNQVARLIFDRIVTMHRHGQITGEELLFLNNELMSFTDICGACERIKNTPIPYSYSAFIKKFLFIYIMTMPFGFVFSVGYFIIPITGIVFYVLASLELIAEEIEDPFGTDSNDLPMDKIAANIEKHIAEILQ